MHGFDFTCMPCAQPLSLQVARVTQTAGNYFHLDSNHGTNKPATHMSQHSSLIYSHQNVYQLVMRLLYGRHFRARYETLAAEIPAGAKVVDLCAGDAYLYRHFLRQKGVDYLGLELSPQFVAAGQAQGVPMREFNVWNDKIPAAEVVIMQASLYQFLPNTDAVVQKMLAAARSKVIIAEPIRNLSEEDGWLGKISRAMTKPRAEDGAYSGRRFNETSLRGLFSSFAAFERSFLIPGGREMVGVFRGRGD